MRGKSGVYVFTVIALFLICGIASADSTTDITTGLPKTVSANSPVPVYNNEISANAVLWDLTHGVYGDYEPSGDFSKFVAIFSSQGYPVTTTTNGVLNEDLSQYKLLIINVASSWNSAYTQAEVTAIKNFVDNGGRLLILGENPDCPNEHINNVSQEFGTTAGVSQVMPLDLYVTNLTAHPVFSGVSTVYMRAAGELGTVPPSEAIAWADDYKPVITVAEGNRVIIFGDMNMFDDTYIENSDNRKLASNLASNLWIDVPIPAPVANFTANITTGEVPLTVGFTDLSSGSPSAWNWNFGDGSASIQQNPVHTYMNAGIYSVTLNVTNAQGYNQTIRPDYISVITVDSPRDSFILLNPGWNFISVPKTLKPENNTALIFKDVDTDGHSIWGYDAAGKRWVTLTGATRVNVLDGIWIYSRTLNEVPLLFSTDPLQTPPIKACFKGWNAVGFSGVSETSAKQTLLSVRDDWSQVIGFDSERQAYEISIINGATGIHSENKNMWPAKGYWLYMLDGNELATISA